MSQVATTLDKAEVLCGGWSPFRSVTEQDLGVFKAATKHLLGVDYTPLLVSTQVVAGMNYHFKCDAIIPTLGTSTNEAIVTIYQPLSGEPRVSNISIEHPPVEHEQFLVGGWSQWKLIDDESQAIFNKALSGLIGIDYTPIEVSEQVVAGMNYKFKCDAQVVSPGAQPYKAMVQIHVGLAKDGIPAVPVLTDIQSFAKNE